MVLYSNTHKQNVLSRFEELRRKQLLCDVTLVVQDVEFEAHKVLLAANSRFFSLMFTSDQAARSAFRLDGVPAEAFSSVLEFIYTAQVSVEEAASQQLLAAARLLEVSDLVHELADLTHSDHEAKPSQAEPPHTSKRKRGRPKKSMDVTERREEELQAADREQLSRQSKRKIRPPVKFRSYKVNSDSGSEESEKRSRKNKNSDSQVQCDDCSQMFNNQLLLRIHRRTHTGHQANG